MFRRKIYDRLLQWKEESQGRTALLIEGARRVGKSTVVEEFGKREYESYILIDFSTASRTVKELFQDLSDLNFFFLQLQLQYRVDLTERRSLIIFDEVQLFPLARQAVKALVKDGRLYRNRISYFNQKKYQRYTDTQRGTENQHVSYGLRRVSLGFGRQNHGKFTERPF